jgi:hypothetical protein
MDPINYSWGEFYETMTSCEGYKDDEKLQNQFAIIEALEKVKSLEEITIPNSVTSMGDYVFYYCENIMIQCNRNSYAEEYAKKNNIPYKIID